MADVRESEIYRMSGQQDLINEMVKQGRCGWFPKGTRFTLMYPIVTKGLSIERYPVVALTWEEGTHQYVTNYPGWEIIRESAE